MKNIKDLSESFNETSFLVLKKENAGLHETIDKLLSEIDFLKGIERPKLVQITVTPAEEIIDTQIHLINYDSRNRALTIEEAKKFEIYVKTKKLLEQKDPHDVDFTKLPSGITNDELLEIAGSTNEQVDQERSETTSLA